MQATQVELSLPANSVLNDTYKIKEVIATSKLSFVYIAENTHEGNQLIIKEFFPNDIALRDLDNKTVINRLPSTKQKFEELKAISLNEALIMQQINHHNIVKYIDHFEENGSIYISMEYYEGTLLDQYLKDFPINDRDHLYASILLPLMNALCYLHEKGILHRDIKPNNIMIDSKGNPYLLDFGSAIYYKTAEDYQIFTSPGYSPLEQYSTISEQGVYTDIYSLAATFYFSLTNVIPPDVSQRLIEDKIGDVRTYNKKVSILLSKTIMWGLAVQAKKRCSSLKYMKLVITIEGSVNRIKNYFK
ncbi:serine/threonine protein kinase [Lysinibacillus agricola]|uniref:Serine/threonine protein kinase n=1 Tax=Lysinibacillus agricola TaxID=2590012 RepID=A0ABX7AMR7_9BACI|nr:MULTISPECIES: serine/threonine-protein kinase [Lysinibacillus]KOS61853.1 serine/threonine protein kinase [Lysinibacillus sp. FJAT-14222]QQP11228.1 serine/threonine protein kinase [Lysinibacillus agricola]